MNQAAISEQDEDHTQYLTFVIDKETYGIHILRVMEIRSWESPTSIPETPSCVKGIINLRGQVVPIVDLRERLDIPPKTYDKFTVVVVVQLSQANGGDVVGLVVDAVSDVYTIDKDNHLPVPKAALQNQQRYIAGLAMHKEKSIILLDCKALLEDKQTWSLLTNTIKTAQIESKEDTQSLFERIGGQEAIDAAVDIFYEKILADNRVNHFFAQTNMINQRKMLKAFLTVAFGGPNNYSGRGLREAHSTAVKKGLSDQHFDAVVELLGGTLDELGVASDDIGEIAKIAESVRADVLNK